MGVLNVHATKATTTIIKIIKNQWVCKFEKIDKLMNKLTYMLTKTWTSKSLRIITHMIRVPLNPYSWKFAQAMGRLPFLALSIAPHLKAIPRFWKNLSSYYSKWQREGRYFTLLKILIRLIAVSKQLYSYTICWENLFSFSSLPLIKKTKKGLVLRDTSKKWRK